MLETQPQPEPQSQQSQAQPQSPPQARAPRFGSAEITALSHLYRGELYRSTMWRNRLDATTNWAVVSTGIALSLTFSHETASPLPLVLVGLLVAVFLRIEARRYRFFDFWRVRAHILETQFFGPILLGQGVQIDNHWNEILYQDYQAPRLHITFADALGRRLRKNYGWIFIIQAVAYVGKLVIHPTPIASVGDLWARAAIGPIPGPVVLLCGLLFHGGLLVIAVVTLRGGRGRGRSREQPTVDRVLELARRAA
ncbi:conserved membrane protein of unknown function [Rhodovastum atsumiense]|uniref:DUF2270 domain-containing protein n=1 Tax=Rhodovastum atsumiense TaxID=504468 RepID=A0A5M6IVG2_9PROT|nr:DUF2270 domain-containing protein [Rhodovastum atsumiense]KAA5612303.1 DUF2270 domain-containing protein [Rhodovastum atsumiense]CAH2601632.1 conserved membrane protein of unknown function [Rhodovastum atsumiense]